LGLQAVRVEGHRLRIEARRAHVDAYLPIGLQARRDHPGKSLYPDLGLPGEALVVHEAHEAARPVAALLDLAAVRVPDAVAEVGAGQPRFLDDKNLIAADTEVPVCDPLRALRVYFDGSADAVEHDEVVARTLHLGELEPQLRACT